MPAEDVTSEGFCGRLQGSLCGCCIGFLLFFISFPLLFWNEFRYVYQEVSIAAVSKADEAPCSGPDGTLDHRLVYVDCPVTAQPVLSDLAPQLLQASMRDPFIGTALSWQVEIYQWIQSKSSETHKNKVGGGTTTTNIYSYHQGWTTQIPGAFFCDDVYGPTKSCPDGKAPQNYGSLPQNIRTGAVQARSLTVRVGASDATESSYGLPTSLIVQITSPARIHLSSSDFEAPRGDFGDLTATNSYAHGDTISTNPPGSEPQIGDVRVTVSGIAAEGSLSLAAKQVAASDGGATFAPFDVPGGYPMNSLKEGDLSKAEFQAELHSDNETTAIALRFIGFLMMWIGLIMITRPLSLVPDLIPCIGPCLGDLAGCMLGCVDCGIASGLSLITIAVAWFAARPMLSFGLIAVGAAIFFGASYFAQKGGNKAQAREFTGHYVAVTDDDCVGSPMKIAPMAPMVRTTICKDLLAQP
eukprot:gnl/MRDRNA2_/MRDRNA2_31924_c0_seq1.p1 gnl/MRDRNA2_/MRDRNA2_31924_c0~~gnl/MRDRNA2_/MRDRNA2_31924_c0_seq1.p1  ORF type:complete len:496 (-),score=56.75 gnl/MRDRNA2_/MRDRNA2_31924_c0_seq1:166-1572(-)